MLKVIKVKRKGNFDEDELVPDLLVLDQSKSLLKKTKTDICIYERMTAVESIEAASGAATIPLAKIKPSFTDSISSLSLNEQEIKLDYKEEEMVDATSYDYYILKPEADLGTLDLSNLYRIYIPDHENYFEGSSDDQESSVQSDDQDSNAEDYYQNDYPDEDDSDNDSGDECSDDDDSLGSTYNGFINYYDSDEHDYNGSWYSDSQEGYCGGLYTGSTGESD